MDSLFYYCLDALSMGDTTLQFFLFTDCIAKRILAHPATQRPTESSTELDEFSTYLAIESWSTLPESIRTATYESRGFVPRDIDDVSLDNTSVAFTDTLVSYGFASDSDDALGLLKKVLVDYIADACAPPPAWSSTRTKECEICEREVPLTYHHLIPRSTHVKVLKKKWHTESKINSVAWLCRYSARLQILSKWNSCPF